MVKEQKILKKLKQLQKEKETMEEKSQGVELWNTAVTYKPLSTVNVAAVWSV